jgi:hypothetical protein
MPMPLFSSNALSLTYLPVSNVSCPYHNLLFPRLLLLLKNLLLLIGKEVSIVKKEPGAASDLELILVLGVPTGFQSKIVLSTNNSCRVYVILINGGDE